MALIKCPECNKEISNKSKTCIHCGYPISEQENKSEGYIKVDNKLYDISKLKKIYEKYSKNERKYIYRKYNDIYRDYCKSGQKIEISSRESWTNLGQWVGNKFNWYQKNDKYYLVCKLIVECINHNFEYFEFNTADYQSVAPTPQPSVPTNQVRCPKCGSTSITTEEQGYGLFGWIGASQKKNLCQKCGYKWWPGR